MKKRIATLLVVTALFAPAEEESFQHLGKAFRIFRAQPQEVRLVWQDEDRKPLYTFQAAYRELAREGKKVPMLTNGGIFEPRQIPSGLYVEKGKTFHPLNLMPGKGNFFLKPNGVFFILDKKGGWRADVVASSQYAKWTEEEKSRVWYAVQSGPALLLAGKTHPAFNRQSKSELLRNGVGVTKEGEVVFVITDGETNVNLWTFADCFRALGCENALFLDGDISQMKVEPDANVKGHGFATMFGVVRE